MAIKLCFAITLGFKYYIILENTISTGEGLPHPQQARYPSCAVPWVLPMVESFKHMSRSWKSVWCSDVYRFELPPANPSRSLLVSLSRFESSTLWQKVHPDSLHDDDLTYLSVIALIARFVPDFHFYVALTQFERSLTTLMLCPLFVPTHQPATLFLFTMYICKYLFALLSSSTSISNSIIFLFFCFISSRIC